MTPNTQQNTNPTMAWYRIQSGVAAQLSDRQAPALYNCFEAVLQGDELIVTAPRGYAEALNQVAKRPASLNAQKLRVAESVRFVEPEPEPEADLWAEIDHTAVDDSEYEPIQDAPTVSPLPAPKPTALRPGQPGYDPWRDTAQLLATVKSYQAEKRRGTAVSAPTPESHEQVAIESDAEPEQDKSEPMEKKTKPVNTDNLWRMALSELKLQIDKATFNTWLNDTTVGGWDENTAVLTVLCRNDYAVETLQARLAETIERVLSFFAKRPVTVRFETRSLSVPTTAVVTDDELDIEGDDDNGAEGDYYTPPVATGQQSFQPIAANWSKVPDFYLNQILPDPTVNPTVKLILGTIIAQTLGKKDMHARHREWWPSVDYNDLADKSGVKSRTSIQKAIKVCLERHWIKRRASRKRYCYDYALRFVTDGDEWNEEL